MSDNKSRIGVLGGSFDPIHFGHIKPCLKLAEIFQLKSIRLIPCKVSPFKESTFTSAQHRWNMVSMIAANSDLFVADSRELERDTPSYTYETLLDLRKEFSAEIKIFWIMGLDALIDFPRWYHAKDILTLCHILVLQRPGYQWTVQDSWLDEHITDDQKQLANKDSGHIYITDTEMVDVSSTQIRDLVVAGEQPKYLLPGGVWNYIKRNNLYQQEQI